MGQRNVFLALANLLIPVAILVFATGFFPYKPFMPGLAQYQDIQQYTQDNTMQEQPGAPFDKLVFMVVDALRSDFVYSSESGMTFVQRFLSPTGSYPVRTHAKLHIQSHTRRHRPPFYRPRHVSYHHHAPRQGHNHRLDPLLCRRNSQLCRVRYELYTRDARHVARTAQSQALRPQRRDGQAGYVRRRHVVEAISRFLCKGGWHEQFFRLG